MSVRNIWLRLLAWRRSGRAALPASDQSHPEAYGPELPPDWTLPLVKKPRAEPYKALRLRRDILEQLDKYQVYVKRLKKYDRETYETYRRLGAYIVCDTVADTSRVGLAGSFRKMMPGFGAVALGMGTPESHLKDMDASGAYMGCRFCTFVKLARPGAGIQLLNSGTTYRARFYWDDTIAICRGCAEDPAILR